jgi:hypothetical protein
MARLSKTTLYTRDENTLYKFYQHYEGREDVTRELNIYPDNNGCMSCIITYKAERLNNEVNQMLHEAKIIKLC